MKKGLIIITLLLMVMGVAVSANALPLPLNGWITPTGASSPGNTSVLLAYLHYDLVGLDASNIIHWTGTLEQWVRPSVNVGKGLVFEYKLANDITSAANITLEDITDYNGWLTWADADGTGANPVKILRSTSSIASSIKSVWDYPEIAPGNNSGLLWIETNAPDYQLTGSTTIQGVGQDLCKTYAPTAPEPASMALLGLGLLGFGGVSLRKKKKVSA